MNYITILHASLQQQANGYESGARDYQLCGWSGAQLDGIDVVTPNDTADACGYPIAAVVLCLRSTAKLNVVNGAFRGMQCGIDVPKGAISQASR